MSQPQLKLTYFKTADRGELTRLILAAGGIEYEDERIEHSAWPALKPTLPLGKLPVLRIDGTLYPQSMAIARYVARRAELYTNDLGDALTVDVVDETLREVMPKLIEMIMLKDETTKEAKTTALIDDELPKLFNLIEDQIQGKFVLGDAMSYVDLQLFTTVEDTLALYLPAFSPQRFVKIQRVIENVKANANIAAYLAKRPANKPFGSA